MLKQFDLLNQRIDRRNVIGFCRAKAAGFGHPRVAFGGARVTRVKADHRREQQRIGQPVRQMELSAELVSYRVVKTQSRLAECHPRQR